jgi:plasmid stabilization system protein ParE
LILELRWSQLAIEEFEQGTDHIAEANPVAAEEVAQRIWDALQKLREFPYIGHVSEDGDLREWAVRHTPYVIVYAIRGTTLEIARVFHTSRQPWGEPRGGG